jgi:N-acetylneuraminate lyase
MKGILPALITPYDDDGSIGAARTRRLVRHLMDRGVNGFYLCGSTGEGFLLSPAERKQLLEIVLSEVKGAVPVIAHIGTMDTATSVELTKHARQAGADAVSAVAPFYYKHGLEQLKEHYLDIANAADIPLVIYHFPAMTGVQAPASFYGELARHENIIGLKYTALDSYGLQQIIAECGPEFLVFNGPDEALLSGLTLGCVGAIGSTYNIMPKLFLKLYREFHAGHLAEARELQTQANEVIRELYKYETIAFVREILRLQGIETGRPRKPIQQLNEAQRRSIRDFALQHSFLEI